MEVIESAGTRNVLACGRRWGKDVLFLDRATAHITRGLPVAWYSPTYKLLSDTWREAKIVWQEIIRYKNEQEKRLEFYPSGSIDFWSLEDPDAGRGRRYAAVFINEAAHARHLKYAWENVISACLLDFSGGTAWFGSTPAGRNYFWKLFNLSKSNDAWRSWRYPTSANPYIDSKYLEDQRSVLPERVYKQEHEAEFLEGEGVVFRNIEACLHDHNHRPGQHRGHFISFGVDWGKHNDYTAISVFCADCAEELQRDRFNQIDYAFQVRRLHALAGRWHPNVILVETNAMGEPVFEQLQREGMPVQGFQTTTSTKPPLIENLALAFEKAEAKWIRDDTWTHELEAYERKVNAVTQRSTYSAPEGLHDDTVMARALAWKAATGSGPLFIEI